MIQGIVWSAVVLALTACAAAFEPPIVMVYAARTSCSVGTEPIPVSDAYVEKRADGWWMKNGSGEWNKVPDELVSRGYNPTGRFVARLTPSGDIVCFVVPTET